MIRMPFTTFATVCCALACVGCAKSDTKSATDSAGGAAATPGVTPATAPSTAATPLSPADVAGTWTLRAVPESGADTTTTVATVTATSDTTGWKETFKNGLTTPLHVTFSGDSIITDGAPHRSVRGKHYQVSTHSVFRKVGDKLVGETTAHYQVKTADSVLMLRTELTKAP
jgi:hypothetical protein